MRVIVAGTRTFSDYRLLERTLDHFLMFRDMKKEDIVIISGAADGADTLGEKYARKRKFKLEKYPADWKKYKKSAGYIRNEEMAKIADACVCFWDGISDGTYNMINLAKQYNLELEVVKYGGT
jgi:hypothetical protein